MPQGFDILVNGVHRTFRDRWEVALASANNLKKYSPTDLVQIVNTETRQVVNVLPDGRVG